MNEFKVGQIVRAVRSSTGGVITKGNLYKITAFYPRGTAFSENHGVCVEALIPQERNPPNDIATGASWLADRFRPL
jgi:hypothetical protein